MAGQDAAFAGSIPQIYDECLVPVLFEPYAQDMAAAAAALAPRDMLEVAAGTGAVTAPLAKALPDARIVATDLNADMVARGQAVHDLPNVEWSVADAQALPFGDGTFDLVVIQFGAMFFPDRLLAYREMKRVLRDGGTLLFNVWDTLAANPGSRTVHDTLHALLPQPKPAFLARTPFGYNDEARIRADLADAGFADCTLETVRLQSPPGSAGKLLRGLTEGSPLMAELSQHDADARQAALAETAGRLAALENAGPFAMSALRISAVS